MALLQEINYNPSEDSMQNVFDKINSAIQSINAVLGGGLAGEAIRKIDGTDFNFEFFDPTDVDFAASSGGVYDGTYTIKTKLVPIGSWNMDADASKVVNHGVTGTIVGCTAIIYKDTGTLKYVFNQYGGFGGGSGIAYVSNVSVNLYRAVFGSTPLEIFDSPDFNDTSINRGYIVVKYID